MIVADFVNHLDDETWVGIGLPAAEGGGMVVFWVADYVGMDDMTLGKLGPYIDRETYDAYLDIFDDPETGERVPRIVIPVAPEDNTEGEDNGDDGNWEIEIPADAKTVTLELEKRCGFTLRSLLPYVKDEVELVVIDEFGVGVNTDADLYRLKANSGEALMRKLARSRVVEGEALLDLTPNVKLVSPEPTLLNGTFATLTGTGFIQLLVKPPAPDEED